MPVSRFETPQEAQHIQTYVSQFVPMPFEEINRRAKEEQFKQDKNADDLYTLKGTMGKPVHRHDAEDEAKTVQSLIYNLDKSVESSNGDLRNMDNVIRHTAQAYKDYRNTGNGLIKDQNYKTYLDYAKKLEENSEHMGQFATLALQGSDNLYEAKGAAAAGARYKPLGTYGKETTQETLMKYINSLHASGESLYNSPDESISFGDDGYGVYRVTANGKKEGVTDKRVLEVAKTAIINDPTFNNKIDVQYDILKYTNRLPKHLENKTDFYEAEVQARLTGVKAFAWENTEKSFSSAEVSNSAGGDGPASKTDNGLALGTSVILGTDETLPLNSEGKVVVESLNKYNKDILSSMFTTESNSGLRETFKTNKPAGNFDAAIGNLYAETFPSVKVGDRTVANSKFDITDHSKVLQLIKAIASGDISEEALAKKAMLRYNEDGTSNYKSIVSEAKNKVRKAANSTLVYGEIAEAFAEDIKNGTMNLLGDGDKDKENDLSKQEVEIYKNWVKKQYYGKSGTSKAGTTYYQGITKDYDLSSIPGTAMEKEAVRKVYELLDRNQEQTNLALQSRQEQRLARTSGQLINNVAIADGKGGIMTDQKSKSIIEGEMKQLTNQYKKELLNTGFITPEGKMQSLQSIYSDYYKKLYEQTTPAYKQATSFDVYLKGEIEKEKNNIHILATSDDSGALRLGVTVGDKFYHTSTGTGTNQALNKINTALSKRISLEAKAQMQKNNWKEQAIRSATNTYTVTYGIDLSMPLSASDNTYLDTKNTNDGKVIPEGARVPLVTINLPDLRERYKGIDHIAYEGKKISTAFLNSTDNLAMTPDASNKILERLALAEQQGVSEDIAIIALLVDLYGGN